MLSLDVSGAFDAVNHTRLLYTLVVMGFPGWVVKWLRSFLTDRSTQLHFDGEISEPVQTTHGVPQGSPISPILFILYTTKLYKDLRQTGVEVTGFADDTSLLAPGRTVPGTYLLLREAHKVCMEWAGKHGMSFSPEKYSLIVFHRGRSEVIGKLQLQEAAIAPRQEIRMLGVIIHRKLLWKKHSEMIAQKLQTQSLAISRTMAATWGPRFHHARAMYSAIIRSSICYGAACWHTPSLGSARGMAKELEKPQRVNLRCISGAYRSTPIRNLETETHIPP